MKEIITNLLKCKSLWSLTAMAMFIFLTVTGKISGEIAMATISMIVTYFFTKKDETPKGEEYNGLQSNENKEI